MNRVVLAASLAAALALVPAAGALAQQTEGQKLQQVRKDNRDIRKDSRDIAKDKAEIKGDAAKLKEERAERNALARKEEHAIENGNLKAAQKLDAARRAEQRDVNAARKDLGRDKADVARDRADRAQEVAKRNRDANKL